MRPLPEGEIMKRYDDDELDLRMREAGYRLALYGDSGVDVTHAQCVHGMIRPRDADSHSCTWRPLVRVLDGSCPRGNP